MRGHPVFIAQHATATCCRECIRKWHKMQPGKELSQVQQDYLVDVIMTWIQREMDKVLSIPFVVVCLTLAIGYSYVIIG